jgi:glycosyltransferase involved in cell wall biosynthesis
MTFHLLMSRPFPVAPFLDDAREGRAPRHAMAELVAVLDAVVHSPDADASAAPLDGLRAKLAGPPALWSLARKVIAASRPGDVVFCPSEAGGLQLAAVAGRKRPRIAVFVHNLDRPRGRVGLKWWNAPAKVDLFMACSTEQVGFLRNFLGLGADRVRHVWDHTDVRFFTPGAASRDKTRPLIVSVGLEQRDYKTLAAATAGLDVDVKVSGFSKDAAALSRTFPDPLPANMSRRFYEWPELAQLYRDADVVVVSCFENHYAAGVQSLMEASSARRPVIVTATRGLAAYIDDAVVAVPPGDADAMRDAIVSTLADRAEAESRAARAHARALQRYDLDRYVGEIAASLRALADGQEAISAR